MQITDLHVRTDSVEIGPDGTVYAGDDNGRIAIIVDGELCFVQAHRAGVKKIAIDARQGLLVSLSYPVNGCVAYRWPGKVVGVDSLDIARNHLGSCHHNTR